MSASNSNFGMSKLTEEQILETKQYLFPEKPIICGDCEGKGFKGFSSFKCSICKGTGFLTNHL